MALRVRSLNSLSYYPANEPPPDRRVELLPQRDISKRDAYVLARLGEFTRFQVTGAGIAVALDFEGLGKFKALQRGLNRYAIKNGIQPPVGTPTKLCVDGQIGPLTLKFAQALVAFAHTQGPVSMESPRSVSELASKVTDYTVAMWSLVSEAPITSSTEMPGDREACAEGTDLEPALPPAKKKRSKLAMFGLLALAAGTLYFASTPNEGDLGDCGCDQ